MSFISESWCLLKYVILLSFKSCSLKDGWTLVSSFTLAVFLLKICLTPYIQKENSEILGYFPQNVFLIQRKSGLSTQWTIAYHTVIFRVKWLVQLLLIKRTETVFHFRLGCSGECVLIFFSLKTASTHWKKHFRLNYWWKLVSN